MKLTFYKYQGTGNDFIIIDNRKKTFEADNAKLIADLCDRRFGIGGDGLLLLQNRKGYDFEMIYFNANGNESSFCGNGSRCMVAFAKKLGIVKKSETKFLAMDGVHTAKISADTIHIKMSDVEDIEVNDDSYVLNTGSPHYVQFMNGVKNVDIATEARRIRYNNRFKKEGVNVNFVEKSGKGIFIRTYERGVEGETLSCGTGVTASALAASIHGIATSESHCEISTPGGGLTVRFHKGKTASFSDIWLEGPARLVYEGEIEINKHSGNKKGNEYHQFLFPNPAIFA